MNCSYEFYCARIDVFEVETRFVISLSQRHTYILVIISQQIWICMQIWIDDAKLRNSQSKQPINLHLNGQFGEQIHVRLCYVPVGISKLNNLAVLAFNVGVPTTA